MQNMVVTSSTSQEASSSMTTSFPVQTPSPTPVTPWINTIPDQKNTQVNAQPGKIIDHFHNNCFAF